MKSKILNAVLISLAGVSIACSGVAIGLSVANANSGKSVSAYETWLENGHSGSEKDFLNWLQGDNGKDGKDGKDATACEHVYSNGYETEVDATCTSIGYKIRTCDNCGEKDYEFIEKTEEHGWDLGLIVIYPCEQDGLTLYTCLTCGTTKAETTAEEGHHYENSVCIACGKEEDPKHIIYTTDPDTFTFIVSGIEEDCPDEIIIPSTHNGFPVSRIGDSAFKDCTNITSVVISEGITSIGASAFSGCTGLNNITIPETVTSIGNSAFSKCTELNSIELPKSLISIGSSFSDCTGLKSITIPGSLTEISASAFSRCTGLESVVIEHGVTSISTYAFNGCTKLYNILIPDSVTTIGNSVFDGCTGLKSIKIPDSVTSFGTTPFIRCSGLVSMQIPFVGLSKSITGKDKLFGAIFGTTNFTGSTSVSQSYTSGAFNDTTYYIPSSLRSVIVTGGTIGHGSFQNCSMLTDIVIDANITSISDYAFYGCRGLKTIVIPKSVTTVGNYSFFSCTALTAIYYKGTAEDWQKVSIGNNNSSFASVTRYYFSEEYPYTDTVTEGNFWHYDDGEIVIWTKED